MPGETAKKPAKKARKKTLQNVAKRKKPKKRKAKRKRRKPRVDREHNNARIRDAFVELLKARKGRPPTAADVAARVRLTRQTVQRHIADMKFEPQKSIWRCMTPDVYAGMCAAARRGSSRCIALWFQIMEGWTPRRDLTSKGKAITGMIAAPGTPEGDAAAEYMAELNDDQL